MVTLDFGNRHATEIAMQSLLLHEFMRTIVADKARQPPIQSRRDKRPRRRLPRLTWRPRRRPRAVRGRA